MKKLYVISKFKDASIIKFNAVQVEDETDNEFILLDKINNRNTFSKSDIDKEFEFLFVTEDRRKIKRQLKRIYKNIENETIEKINHLNYKINELKMLKDRNEQNYNMSLNIIEGKID